MGLFGLVAVNLRHALSTVEERVEIVAYVLRGTPTESIAQASADIAAFPEVSGVNYVSEDEALKRARTELVEFRDVYRDLSTNPLPASLEVRLKPGLRDAESVATVAERLKGFGFIDDVRYGRDWIAKLDRLRNLLGFVGLMVGAAFAVVAVVIIGTTIRMAVLQRAREISIMRLVGATDWFVRGPFLLEGAVKGLLGGLLAIAMCAGTFSLVTSSSGLLAGLVFFEPIHLIAGVLFGVAMGLGASLVSVGRHLRDV